jgi:uncharacterized membrane protein
MTNHQRAAPDGSSKILKMRTARGFERLVNFSDAVIAIAITLLVLPLVEIPGELLPSESMADVLSEHRGEIGGFVLSFLVIWTFWDAHHQIMEHFRAYDHALVRLHMVFLFTLVTLPFSTELISRESDDRAVPFYVGTLLVTSLTLVGITLRGRRKPELLQTDRAEVQRWMARPVSWYNVIVLVFALVVSLIRPDWGTWALLLLLFGNLIDRLIAKVRGKPRPDPED